MFYTVNLTISLGDIINFFILLAAIVAVIIQNRALKISEKELNTKVTDLESIVNQLEQERQDRNQQINDRKDEDLRLLNYTSSVVGTEQENRRMMEEIFYNHFSTLNLSSIILSKTLHAVIEQLNKNVANQDESNTAETLPILNALQKIAEANKVDAKSYEFSKQFNRDIRDASKKYDERRSEISSTTPYSKKFEEEFANAKTQFDIDLAFAVKKHNDESTKYKIDFAKINGELTKAIAKIV